MGPGKLLYRDKNDLHGIETEKKLFQTEHPGWKKVAAKMVESGVGLDLFIAAAGGRYMDVATIGMILHHCQQGCAKKLEVIHAPCLEARLSTIQTS